MYNPVMIEESVGEERAKSHVNPHSYFLLVFLLCQNDMLSCLCVVLMC